MGIINDIYNTPPSSPPLSLFWPALRMNESSAIAFARINNATKYEEVRDAARLVDTPAQNLVYGDVEGNIAYIYAGKIPVRQPGHSGRYPVLSSQVDLWVGWREPNETIAVLNPKEVSRKTKKERKKEKER